MRKLLTGLLATALFSVGTASADVSTGLEQLTSQNFEEAVSSFKTAFENGDGDGAFYLGRMVEMGLGIDADPKRAAVIYAAAIEKNSALAMNRLGIMHLAGDGILQDYVRAAELICRSADLGNSDAQFNCANLYLQGKGVALDNAKAVELLTKASEADHVAAMNFLGLAYLNGQGTEMDREKARALFVRTAEFGNAMGLYQLGLLHINVAEGEEADLVQAHAYMNLAAERGFPQASEIRASLEETLTGDDVARAQQIARDRLGAP